MTKEQVKYRLEALRWYDIHIRILKEQIVKYDKEIQVRERQGRYFDLQEFYRDSARERVRQVQEAKTTILGFVKMYASEDDAELLLKHFFEGMTYQQMAESMFYSERTIIKKVGEAIKRITKSAENLSPADYPY